jgi:hypothetical protein
MDMNIDESWPNHESLAVERKYPLRHRDIRAIGFEPATTHEEICDSIPSTCRINDSYSPKME